VRVLKVSSMNLSGNIELLKTISVLDFYGLAQILPSLIF
jgi:hypothetical protein